MNRTKQEQTAELFRWLDEYADYMKLLNHQVPPRSTMAAGAARMLAQFDVALSARIRMEIDAYAAEKAAKAELRAETAFEKLDKENV